MVLKATDGRDIKVWGDETHVRQPAGPQATWQESVVLTWWDATSKVGGFHRIGHVPNDPTGAKVALWNNITSPQGTYKNTQWRSLRKEDILGSGGWGGGDETCRSEFINGEHVWTITDGEVSARLAHKDVGPNIDSFPKGDVIQGDLGAAHFDIPGIVTGWVEVSEQRYIINGLGIRDHAWGPRDTSSMLSHRWVVGTCGRDFSFVFVSFHSTNAEHKFSSFGWVVRDGEITYAKKIDTITYVEVDSASNRGGHLSVVLTTDEKIEIECTAEPPKAFISYHQNVACLDKICKFDTGNYKGFCTFESTTNMQHGTRRPKTYVGALIDNGFYKDEKSTEAYWLK